MKTRELPEKINPGDELEVQLAPFGDFPNVVEEDGKRKKIMQRFGAIEMVSYRRDGRRDER